MLQASHHLHSANNELQNIAQSQSTEKWTIKTADSKESEWKLIVHFGTMSDKPVNFATDLAVMKLISSIYCQSCSPLYCIVNLEELLKI